MSDAAWSDLFNGMRRGADARAAATVDAANASVEEAMQRTIDIWKGRAEMAEAEVAGGFAVQYALEAFVERCYPNHPLMKDERLRKRIYDAGVAAAMRTRSFEAARQVGRTFDMPAEVLEPVKRTTEMLSGAAGDKSRLGELEAEAARLRAQLTAAESRAAALADTNAKDVARLIRDCAHHMAHAAAFREQLRRHDPAHPLVVDPELRKAIADAAYAKLAENGGSDWSVVKETGKSYPI